MREIKFRGLSDGKWIFGNLFMFTGNINKGQCYISDYGSMVDHSLTNDMNDAAIGFFKKVDADTVGQYTGLKDKNGVEIYEGDIVRITNNFQENEVDYNAQIIFKDGGFCAVDGTEDNYGVRRYRLSDFGYELKIVGNIYGNLELLEDK